MLHVIPWMMIANIGTAKNQIRYSNYFATSLVTWLPLISSNFGIREIPQRVTWHFRKLEVDGHVRISPLKPNTGTTECAAGAAEGHGRWRLAIGDWPFQISGLEPSFFWVFLHHMSNLCRKLQDKVCFWVELTAIVKTTDFPITPYVWPSGPLAN